MDKVFIKVAVAAMAIAGIAYGTYKLYERYCGAKVARKNKFRSRFEDVGYNFDDDDEYLEDDDVYYFGQDTCGCSCCGDIDEDETAEDFDIVQAEDIDEAETQQDAETDMAKDLESASIEELLSSEDK